VGGGKRANSILKDQDVESRAGIEGETKEVTEGNGILVSTHPPFLATSSITSSQDGLHQDGLHQDGFRHQRLTLERHLQPHTATYSHIQPHTATYSHIQPHTATYSHIQPHTATYSHLQPHTATYSHIQPHTATYSHIQPHTATYTPKDARSTTATTTASSPASWPHALYDVHAPAILNDQASDPVQEQGKEREEGKERDTGKCRGCDSIEGSESMNGRGSAPEDIVDKTEQSSFVRVVINRASGQCRGAAAAAGRRQGADRGDGKMGGESGGGENGGVSTTKFQPKFEGHKFDNDICELFAFLRR